jgi:hypothetical protein
VVIGSSARFSAGSLASRHLRQDPDLGGARPGGQVGARPARPGRVDRWIAERDAVYNQVFERGWNAKIGGFTQSYGSEVLDSSLLMMPLQGLISPRDPMWLSTLRAIDRERATSSATSPRRSATWR